MLVGKGHLLDETGPTLQIAHRHVRRDREEVPREQATEKVEGEVLQPARIAGQGRGNEHVEEDHREDEHLAERIQKAPDPAEHRLLVAGAEFLEGQQVEQVPMGQGVAKRHLAIECTQRPMSRPGGQVCGR